MALSKIALDSSSFTDKNAYERLKCPHCKRLLNNPVQPSCGHRLCQVCADDIINSGPSPPRCPLEDCREEFELEDGEPVRTLSIPDYSSIGCGHISLVNFIMADLVAGLGAEGV